MRVQLVCKDTNKIKVIADVHPTWQIGILVHRVGPNCNELLASADRRGSSKNTCQHKLIQKNLLPEAMEAQLYCMPCLHTYCSSVKFILRCGNNDTTKTSNGAENRDQNSSNDTEPRGPEVPVGPLGLLHQKPEDGRQRVGGWPKT